jgi:CRISPR-associated endonuclease/helicase Cas3
VPHAIWGAAFAYGLIYKAGGEPETWKEFALPIQGHHAGLPDSGEAGSNYEHFFHQNPDAPAAILQFLSTLDLPRTLPVISRLPGTRRELFLRMAFSALVDADRLDTELHFDPERRSYRGNWPCIDELWSRFQRNQEHFQGTFAPPKNPLQASVLRVRREVYDACLSAAEGPPGVYRLTVPTGGGKTRSGLAFALRHASIKKLRRVVVAIPYTSIIDQTAGTFREILGADAVLEHHSQIQAPEGEGQDERSLRLRLASENWDAPLIVTTTVQLFESLFANRPGRVRKLHNLARSVILIDEAQSLPPDLLKPTLDALRALVEEYGVTLVLSTATQPAFEQSVYLTEFEGLTVREIVPNYAPHFERLRRVRYSRTERALDWVEVAHEVKARRRIMLILNARKDALAVLKALGEDPDAFHLSTLLCGAHRRAVLHEVATRLKERQPVRLVSTQVVEAGVDLDFPEVWRAIGPLDRIIQAAGRCNRHGSDAYGQVIIFAPAEGRSPRGPYAVGIEKAKLILDRYGVQDLDSPGICQAYFAELFATVDLDAKRIQAYRGELNFPEVATRYRLIADDTVPVVVRYGEGFERLASWKARPSLETWRKVQPYLVSLYRHEVARLLAERWLEPVSEGLYGWMGQYHARLGLAEAMHDPSDLIW